MEEALKYILFEVIESKAYLDLIFSQCYAKVLDYRAIGLSSRQTIDTHPLYQLTSANQSVWNTPCLCLHP